MTVLGRVVAMAYYSYAELAKPYPECPYSSTCLRVEHMHGAYRAYFCQCHHGRKLNDPEFAHEAMKRLAKELTIKTSPC